MTSPLTPSYLILVSSYFNQVFQFCNRCISERSTTSGCFLLSVHSVMLFPHSNDSLHAIKFTGMKKVLSQAKFSWSDTLLRIAKSFSVEWIGAHLKPYNESFILKWPLNILGLQSDKLTDFWGFTSCRTLLSLFYIKIY